MKKYVMILLVFVLLLSACSAGTGDEGTTGKQTQASNQTQTSQVTAQDYFKYLNDVFVPEHSLASTERITLDVDTMDFHYAWDFTQAGGTGLISAVVEDFDNDGTLELLAVEAQDVSIMNTFYNKVVFADDADYDPEQRCVLLRGWLFDCVQGQIVEQAYGTLTLMPEPSWGKLVVGIEKVEEEYYLFASVDGEDMTTYGPAQFTVTRIGGDSLSPMYSSVLDYCRANKSNYLELLGIENSINIRESTLSDLQIPSYEKDASEFRNLLGNRLLCIVDFDYVEFGGDEMAVTVTDYTNLREYLKNNGENWQRIQLPEGARKEIPDVPADAQNWIDEIAAAAETEIRMDSNKLTDGLCEMQFSTSAGNTLYLSWDLTENALKSFSLGAYHSMPDEEWYAIKDGILDSGILELTQEDKALFYGEVKKWDVYMDGLDCGKYTIHLFSVAVACFSGGRNA